MSARTDTSCSGLSTSPCGIAPRSCGFACLPWLLIAAAAAFALPSLARLADAEWSQEQGAVGPIILASGAWLLWREAHAPPPITPTPACGWRVAALLAPVLGGYLLARVTGTLGAEWLAAYATLVVLLYAYVGGLALARLWFPLVYLLFLVPPPYSVLGPLVQSRKLWLSTVSVDLLSRAGLDVASSGTAIYVDQYELLIANACAGMNSLISLLAILLFYAYVVHRSDWRYAALLVVLTLPVATLANLARIMLLILVTHGFGIAVAEGILHMAAGLFMFVVALVLLLAADAVLRPAWRRLRWT